MPAWHCCFFRKFQWIPGDNRKALLIEDRRRCREKTTDKNLFILYVMAFEWTNVINEIDQIEEKNSLALAKTTTITTTTTTPLVLRWLRHCLLHEVFPIESKKEKRRKDQCYRLCNVFTHQKVICNYFSLYQSGFLYLVIHSRDHYLECFSFFFNYFNC